MDKVVKKKLINVDLTNGKKSASAIGEKCFDILTRLTQELIECENEDYLRGIKIKYDVVKDIYDYSKDYAPNKDSIYIWDEFINIMNIVNNNNPTYSEVEVCSDKLYYLSKQLEIISEQ